MKKYYLNIGVKAIEGDNESAINCLKKAAKAFQESIKDEVAEFDQEVFKKEFDKDGQQVTLCYKGDFADLAIFADNIIAGLENEKIKDVFVFFGEEPIVGDSLLLYPA